MIHHPIRDEIVNVWIAPDGQAGPRAIAMFGTGGNFPIYFAGSEAEAREKAEAFRADVIAKNEAAFLARQENIAKARAARAKGKAGEAA